MENQTTPFESSPDVRTSLTTMVTPVTSEGSTQAGEMNVVLNISGHMVNLTDILAARTNAELSDDAIWILTSTFIIFTMQSGFGLLESGSVSTKNEVNIMVKNAMDVIFGGLTYWLYGYAFSFGEKSWANAFSGWGHFAAQLEGSDMGDIYAKFFFQSSFATTATTIVSGSMAERTKLEAYILFSALNTVVYCFPAHWVWAPSGWLNKLGMIDIAGAGPVHLCGGMTGLVATVMLKPRHKRYESSAPQMGSPTNALLGTFMLWWGWLGFNCGSTFGISGAKWKLAARSAMNTLNSSIGGGVMGTSLTSAITTLIASCAGGILAALVSYIFKRRTFDITYLINGLLGSLVGITAFCALSSPWESFIIGMIGAAVAIGAVELIDKFKIDDPVGCVGVHGVGALWGLICVGLFAKKDPLNAALGYPTELAGVFYGGGFYLLGVQLLGCLAISVWTIVVSYVLLKGIDLTIGLRVPLEEELLGADIVEHGLGDVEYAKGGMGGLRQKPGRPSALSSALMEGGVVSLVTSISSSNSVPSELNSYSHRLRPGAFGAKRRSGPSAADILEVAEMGASPSDVTLSAAGTSLPAPRGQGKGRRAGRVFSRLFRKRRKYVPTCQPTANGGLHEMTIRPVATGTDHNHQDMKPAGDGDRDAESTPEASAAPSLSGNGINQTHSPQRCAVNAEQHVADGENNSGFRSDVDAR